MPEGRGGGGVGGAQRYVKVVRESEGSRSIAPQEPGGIVRVEQSRRKQRNGLISDPGQRLNWSRFHSLFLLFVGVSPLSSPSSAASMMMECGWTPNVVPRAAERAHSG